MFHALHEARARHTIRCERVKPAARGRNRPRRRSAHLVRGRPLLAARFGPAHRRGDPDPADGRCSGGQARDPRGEFSDGDPSGNARRSVRGSGRRSGTRSMRTRKSLSLRWRDVWGSRSGLGRGPGSQAVWPDTGCGAGPTEGHWRMPDAVRPVCRCCRSDREWPDQRLALRSGQRAGGGGRGAPRLPWHRQRCRAIRGDPPTINRPAIPPVESHCSWPSGQLRTRDQASADPTASDTGIVGG